MKHGAITLLILATVTALVISPGIAGSETELVQMLLVVFIVSVCVSLFIPELNTNLDVRSEPEKRKRIASGTFRAVAAGNQNRKVSGTRS